MPAAVVAGGVVVALLVAWLVEAVAGRVARRSPFVADLSRYCHRPMCAILVVVLGWVGLLASTHGAPWRSLVSHVLTIVLIGVVAWLLAGLARVLEVAALRRYATDRPDDRQSRRVLTQAQLLRRIAVAVIVVWAVGAALLTFPEVRVVRASVFASAGLLSVVAGLAALVGRLCRRRLRGPCPGAIRFFRRVPGIVSGARLAARRRRRRAGQGRAQAPGAGLQCRLVVRLRLFPRRPVVDR